MTNNDIAAKTIPDPLTADEVLNRCDPATLGFDTTAALEPLGGTLGQTRALKALEFGARMNGDGFNIYVLGTPGSDRHQVVSQFLEQESQDKPKPIDWCYVNNFSDPVKPKGIALPAGTGNRFRQDIAQLLEDLQASIPAAFESENYRNRLAEIEDDFNEHSEQARAGRSAEAEAAKERSSGLLPTPHGFRLSRRCATGKPLRGRRIS